MTKPLGAAKNFWSEFRKFAVKGNVLDLAVAVIVGGAFSKVTASLAGDLITPIISLPLKGVSFVDRFVALDGGSYSTLAEARAAGAAVLAYGSFLSTVIDFLFMALAVFLLVRLVTMVGFFKPDPPPPPPPTKTCPYCLSGIPPAATRCAHCTSVLE